MSLPVIFHRAASAEFIEASAWHETKRIGLALPLSSLPRLIVACRWHLNILSSLPLFAKKFGVSSRIVFHTAFIFARRNIALLSWRYFIAVETPPFGRLEPNE